MKITLSARSKILQLSNGYPFRIQAIGTLLAGSHVDLIPNATITASDVTICASPPVIADIGTLTLLNNRDVDFDYDSDEFIISNRGK